MGIEADTGSPWVPSKVLLRDLLPHVIRSIYDPLTILTDEGKVGAVPRRVRQAERRLHGVDDQGAPRRHVPRRHAARRRRPRRQPDPVPEVVPDRPRCSPTSRRTRRQPADREVDDLTVTITMKRPWVTFPLYLSARSDYMACPTWKAAADKDPTFEVEARRHRPVRLRGLQAGRVVHGEEEPELLEQALPVPRRDRVPRHPRRAQLVLPRSRPATST